MKTTDEIISSLTSYMVLGQNKAARDISRIVTWP